MSTKTETSRQKFYFEIEIANEGEFSSAERIQGSKPSLKGDGGEDMILFFSNIDTSFSYFSTVVILTV